MPHYTSISIIYNPNSTGASKALSEELKSDLKQLMPKQVVTLVPTKYAGHAEKLAYKLAMETKKPLIISSSGDGGYHEVINGLMKAQAAGAKPIAGLLPAGNANDHFHFMHNLDSATAIKLGKSTCIDLLKLATTSQGKKFERYAHSYIGIGLTPSVGQELNKTTLNILKETWIVLKTIFVLQPARISIDGEEQSYDSLIFSNIAKMSKVLSLSSVANNVDGKFEITAFRRHNKLRLIASLLEASTKGLESNLQASSYDFQTIQPLMIQLDGEVTTLDANTAVSIAIQPKTLNTIN